jgi:anti-anti-sigma factor
MRITERSRGTTTILDLHGTLYAPEAVEQIGTAVRRLARGGRHQIVMNLADVPAIDAAGLGALVDAHCEVRRAGGSLTLARVAKRLRVLLAVTGLLAVFAIVDTVEEASRTDARSALSTPSARVARLSRTPQGSTHSVMRSA